MTDLRISDELKKRACDVYDEELARDVDDPDHYGESPTLDAHAEIVALNTVAPAVVAAELRRIARSADERYQPSGAGRAVESTTAYKRQGVELVLRDLFARADELDGGA